LNNFSSDLIIGHDFIILMVFFLQFCYLIWKVCRTQVYMWKKISEKKKTVCAWDWTGVISGGWSKSLTTRPSGLTGPCFTDRFYSNFNRIDHMLTVFNQLWLSIFCIVLSECQWSFDQAFTFWVYTSLSQQTVFPVFNCMRNFYVQCNAHCIDKVLRTTTIFSIWIIFLPILLSKWNHVRFLEKKLEILINSIFFVSGHSDTPGGSLEPI
jgi:hypothetical protein